MSVCIGKRLAANERASDIPRTELMNARIGVRA